MLTFCAALAVLFLGVKGNSTSMDQNTTFSPETTTFKDKNTEAESTPSFECNLTITNSSKSECKDEKSVSSSVTVYKIITRQQFQDIDVILKWVQIALCVVALGTNILNTAVFLAQTRCSTNHYLIAIAVIDILSAATQTVGSVYAKHVAEKSNTDHFYLVYGVMTLELYLNPVLQRFLYFLVLHVSIERLLVVTFPLKAKDFLYMRHPKVIIVVSFLVVAVFHVFSPLRYVIIEMNHPPTNSTRHTLLRSQLFEESDTELNNASTASKVIFVYILLIAALVANLVVVFALKRHSSTARHMKAGSDTEKGARRERKTTITIITSSLIFLGLALPLNTASIYSTLRPDLVGPRAPYSYVYRLVFEVSKILILVSFSTDFLTYMSLSTTFRKTCFRLLRISRPEPPSASMYSIGNTRVSHVSLDTGTGTGTRNSLETCVAEDRTPESQDTKF